MWWSGKSEDAGETCCWQSCLWSHLLWSAAEFFRPPSILLLMLMVLYIGRKIHLKLGRKWQRRERAEQIFKEFIVIAKLAPRFSSAWPGWASSAVWLVLWRCPTWLDSTRLAGLLAGWWTTNGIVLKLLNDETVHSAIIWKNCKTGA